MRRVQYNGFGDPRVLEMTEVPTPEPGPGEVRVSVHAVGLNPVDDQIFRGVPGIRFLEARTSLTHPGRALRERGRRFPRGVARDLAGVVDAVGPGVDGLEVGQDVLGSLRSAPGDASTNGALAELVLAPAADLAPTPDGLDVAVAASLGVAAQTACGALRRLGVEPGNVLLVSAAAGSVGSLAVQLAVRRGATVLGIAGPGNADYLESLGAVPIAYGQGLEQRVRAAAPGGVSVALDCFGGPYVALARRLGVPGRRVGTLVPSPAAVLRGAQITGSRDGGPGDMETVARLVSTGEVSATVADVVPFEIDAIREAYGRLASKHVRGKLVVRLAAAL